MIYGDPVIANLIFDFDFRYLGILKQEDDAFDVVTKERVLLVKSMLS